MAIKTFTTGEVLTASDTNTYLANSGLVYVGTTAFNGVTPQFTSVFNSTYDHYRVLITGINNATTTIRGVTLKLLSGSTPTSDSTYTTNYLLQYGVSTSGGVGVLSSTSIDIFALSSNTGGSSNVTLEVFNPNNAVNTFFTAQTMSYQSNVSTYVMRTLTGIHATQTAYTGFQLAGVADNISGTVTVYGYRKA